MAFDGYRQNKRAMDNPLATVAETTGVDMTDAQYICPGCGRIMAKFCRIKSNEFVVCCETTTCLFMPSGVGKNFEEAFEDFQVKLSEKKQKELV